MFDALAKRNQGKLTLEEKAEFRCLPETLGLNDILRLWFGLSLEIKRKDIDAYKKNLKFSEFMREEIISAIEAGKLVAEKQYPGWYRPGYYKIPISELFGSEKFNFAIDENSTHVYASEEWLNNRPHLAKYKVSQHVGYSIHRNDFRKYLKAEEKWPIEPDCLLSRWWPDELKNIETALKECCGKDYRPCYAEQVKKILDVIDDLGIPRKQIPEEDKKRILSIVNMTPGPFNKAWSAAQVAGILRIDNYENRTRKGQK